MKKPRSDSKLKNLPDDAQEKIMEWCKEGYEHARKQLAADGIRVSVRAIAEFYSWYRLQRRFSDASQRARHVEELLAQKDASLSPERIRELGQVVFTMEALEEGDKKGYVELEYLQLARESAKTKAFNEREKLALAREKFEVQSCERFLKWFKDRKAREIAESNLSNSEKIAALRAEYFADVDELEAAGTVVLPERS